MKRKILQRILKWITEKVIKKYNPLIVAVTGSVGKTSTKEAIYTTLKRYRSVRRSNKNLNTEIGAPLVFLGVNEPGKTFKEWLKIILKGFKLIIIRDKNYPAIIVMEMAADKPGDIEYLTGFIKPHIGVVTAIGETPVHVEFYKDVNEVVKEKSLLVKNTKKGGNVILNADDGRVFQMKGRAKTKVKTFGLSNRAEIRAVNLKLTGSAEDPRGVSFEINHDTEKHEIKLPNIFDEGSVYSVLAAIGVGVSVGIPIYRLVESCEEFNAPKGRMRFLEGEKVKIIDSSYNSAPKSTEMALKTLEKLPAKRKVAVLGDMLELGESSEKAHIKIGEQVGFVDLLITVGKDSIFIGESAQKDKFKGEWKHFKDSEEAKRKIADLLREDDLVLVKGSQSIRTEKIIEKIIDNPEKKLVRQEDYWKMEDEQN